MNIVFEGLPGSGKSTLISKVMHVQKGMILGEFCKDALGTFGDIEYFVNNEKKKNEWMRQTKNDEICCLDRFWHSTLVANAVSCGVESLEELKSLYDIIYKGYEFEEYVYIFLDISSELSLSRNENLLEAKQCMWFQEVFNQKAYKMYHRLYDNLELFTSHKICKIKLDSMQYNVEEELQNVNKMIQIY